MPVENGALLTLKDCEKILFKFDKDARLKKYEIRRVSDKVVGFLASHYFVTIEYTKNNQNEVSSQRFFFKTMPVTNEKQRAYIESMGIFKKEIMNYKNILSQFSQLISKPVSAKYYFSRNDDCLVMEDLSSLNYQVCNMEYLDKDKCIGALRALSGLHSGSLIFEELRSKKEHTYRLNEQFAEELTESTFSFKEGHVRNMWCKTTTACLQKLSTFFSENEEMPEKIKQYVFSEKGLRKFLKPSEKYRNTVCHDDLWCNNMMFNEKNECILLDFQLSRYTPPVFDVLLLLYLGNEKTFLDENMDYLLDLYYSFLSLELLRHDLNIEEIISKSDFFESVEEYRLPALVEACMYGTNVYLPENISSAVVSNPETFIEYTMKDRPSFIIAAFEQDEKFRKRFSTVLKPMFQLLEKSLVNCKNL